MLIGLEALSPEQIAAWKPAARHRMTTVRAAAEDRPAEEIAQLADRVLTSVTDNVWRVLADGADTGWVWLLDRGDSVVLADLEVRAKDVASVWPVLAELIRSRGWSELSYSVFRGDGAAESLASVAGGRLVATHMQTQVDNVAAPVGIRLVPMTPAQYAEFATTSVEHYADDLFGAGGYASREEAWQDSREQFDQLLPAGQHTPDHYLWTAYAGEASVGRLWIARQPSRAFIYDIVVDEAARGRGYGTQMLRAGAAEVRTMGRKILALNVFGHNPGARRLYEQEGYVTTEQIFETTPTS